MKNDNINFWKSIWNFGRRAVGAIYREFTSNDSSNEITTESIGPILIRYKNGRIIGENSSDSTVVLSIASTNNMGNVQESKEIFLKPGQSRYLDSVLADNKAGLISWRCFDHENSYKDGHPYSGGLITSVSNWYSGQLTLSNKDLMLDIDNDRNEFLLRASKYNYTNITIEVVARDGSLYNFGPFDVNKGKPFGTKFPGVMDAELPLTSILFTANCDENAYKALLLNSAE